MEIRRFAERVLFANTLEEKLAPPLTPLSDYRSGKPITIPVNPQRPPELKFNKSKKIPFPKKGDLDHAIQRGYVFHFFANHELLAMELMALALLRFTDAPNSFRKAIVETIKEEQIHLGLYLQRMKVYGVSFGEIGLSDFFWKHLKEMPSPAHYIAGMSLTFEQANLDFSLHYRKVFEQLNDKMSADILNTVYEDEIGHVKFGVNWFKQNTLEPTDSLWKAYQEHLDFPLSPARAKGRTYSIPARQAAGFDEHFIRELEVFNASKGRVPDLFYYNGDYESELASNGNNKIYQATHLLHQLNEDLEQLLLFIAKKEDIILCRKRPHVSHLLSLQNAGFEIPQIELLENRKIPESLISRPINRFRPWGSSPSTIELSKQLKMVQITRDEHDYHHSNKRKIIHLRAKFRSNNPQLEPLLGPKEVDGILATDIPTIKSYGNLIKKSLGIASIVVKRAFSTAGRARKIVNAISWRDNDIHWIEQALEEEGCLLVEPWLPRLSDFSLLHSPEKGFQPAGKFISDRKGVYRGHHLGRSAHLCPIGQEVFKQIGAPLQVFLKELNPPLPETYGLDLFSYQLEQRGTFIYPLLEINTRFTMGFIAQKLNKHIAPKVDGAHILVPLRKTDTPYRIQAFIEAHPIKRNAGRKIIQGCLSTTPLFESNHLFGLLIVGKTELEQFKETFPGLEI